MCGILFIPRANMFPLRFITDVMERLEEKRGGDGNGIWYCSADGWRVEKGNKMEVEEAAALADTSRGAALFHTRKVSKGAKLSEYCHPFIVRWHDSKGEERTGALVHNGTWDEYETYIPALLWNRQVSPMMAWDMSDTAVAAEWVRHLGPEFLLSLPDDSGCWVYSETGTNQAVMHAYGNIVQAQETKWGWVYASEGGLKDPELEPVRGQSALLTPGGPIPLAGAEKWKKPTKVATYERPASSYKPVGTSAPLVKTTHTRNSVVTPSAAKTMEPTEGTLSERTTDNDFRASFQKTSAKWKVVDVLNGVHDRAIDRYGVIPTDIDEMNELLFSMLDVEGPLVTGHISVCDSLKLSCNEFLGVLLLGDIEEENLRFWSKEVMEKVKQVIEDFPEEKMTA